MMMIVIVICVAGVNKSRFIAVQRIIALFMTKRKETEKTRNGTLDKNSFYNAERISSINQIEMY